MWRLTCFFVALAYLWIRDCSPEPPVLVSLKVLSCLSFCNSLSASAQGNPSTVEVKRLEKAELFVVDLGKPLYVFVSQDVQN